MNAIPTVMVERVESLSIGGAPTYGSDAISGVNNIILRDKFEGAEVELGFGRTTKNDNDRYSGLPSSAVASPTDVATSPLLPNWTTVKA